MKYSLTLAALTLMLSSTFSQSYYFPPADNDDWAHLSPDSLNWCADSIQLLYDFLEEEQTKSFVVLKDGKIVLEEYFGTYERDSLWFWFSAGKSLRSLLVGIAQEEGYLDIHDRTSDYLGEGWTSLPSEKEDSITIWHQLTMTTGLDEDEFFCTDPECLTYVADAGTRWYYHNGPYSLLKEVLSEATGQGINVYTNSRVRNKIEMNSGFWLPVGYNTFFLSTALDMARFGLLILNEGTWDGTAVINDMEYFQQMINSSQALNPSYGYLWWLNGKDTYIPPSTSISFPGPMAPAAPSDVILAAGAQGQYISISPSEGLVIVRQGTSNDDDLAAVDLHNEIWERLSQLECTISTIDEVEETPIEVYPNPANKLLNVNVTNNIGSAHMYLKDMGGRIVLSQGLMLGENTIDVHSLSKGMYTLLVIGNQEEYVKRVVIK
ncbi:MAG: serine hydrolase [Chitinophagales bacterium]|nr:serine hydrolase [Chitinophagales bacterium]